jgi:hypothetical protein
LELNLFIELIVQKIPCRHYALAESANMLADSINATVNSIRRMGSQSKIVQFLLDRNERKDSQTLYGSIQCSM